MRYKDMQTFYSKISQRERKIGSLEKRQFIILIPEILSFRFHGWLGVDSLEEKEAEMRNNNILMGTRSPHTFEDKANKKVKKVFVR